jgi:hypothetical protein
MKTKTRNKTKRNNKKKTQNKRRKSLFFRKVVGGEPTITKQIRPKKKTYKLMIIPCEDVHDSSECKNKETVLIQKPYFDFIKGLQPKHEHYMGLLMDKSDIVKVESDVLPEPKQKPLSSKAHTVETFLRYIKTDPTKIIKTDPTKIIKTDPTKIGDRFVYYQLVPFEPFILELGHCTKKTETKIIFEKVKKDIHGESAYKSVTTINSYDILNGEVLLTTSYFVGVFTKLKQQGSLNVGLIESIRVLIQNPGLKTSDQLKLISSKSVLDLFGPTTPLSRSISQPIIRHTLSDIDFTTGESINSSSESKSTFADSQGSSIRTIDTSLSLSPPPPPPSPPPPQSQPLFIKRSPPKKSSRNSK